MAQRSLRSTITWTRGAYIASFERELLKQMPIEESLAKGPILEHLRAVKEWANELAKNASALAVQCQKLEDRIEPPEVVPTKGRP